MTERPRPSQAAPIGEPAPSPLGFRKKPPDGGRPGHYALHRSAHLGGAEGGRWRVPGGHQPHGESEPRSLKFHPSVNSGRRGRAHISTGHPRPSTVVVCLEHPRQIAGRGRTRGDPEADLTQYNHERSLERLLRAIDGDPRCVGRRLS